MDLGDWIFDNLGKLLIGLIVLMVFLVFVAGYGEIKQQEAFMADCLQDLKQYECTAMWKSSQPQIVPFPVVIPVR
jgi:hypothetical protein